jgi:hypothetical protein
MNRPHLLERIGTPVLIIWFIAMILLTVVVLNGWKG